MNDVRAILQSLYDKGELSQEGFDALMAHASKPELISAAISLKPNDERARLLIRRYRELD